MDLSVLNIKGMENLKLEEKTPFVYICNNKAAALKNETGNKFEDGYLYRHDTKEILSTDGTLTFSIANMYTTFTIWDDGKPVKWCYDLRQGVWNDGSPITADEAAPPMKGRRTAYTEALNLVICPTTELGKPEPTYMILSFSKTNKFTDEFLTKRFKKILVNEVAASGVSALYEVLWTAGVEYVKDDKGNDWYNWMTFEKKTVVGKQENLAKLDKIYEDSKFLINQEFKLNPQLAAAKPAPQLQQPTPAAQTQQAQIQQPSPQAQMQQELQQVPPMQQAEVVQEPSLPADQSVVVNENTEF